ncbi:transposase [Bacillus songklensis]
MISHMIDSHSSTHALQTFFHYIDGMQSLRNLSYLTGRPPLCRKAFLKSFFLKTWFRLDSLRKLRKFLEDFPYFSHLCGFSQLPHLATFARVATWFREEGYESINLETLQRMGLHHTLVAVIDSTVLRSSLYDSQAAKGKSTRFSWYKGYKLHLCMSAEGVVLSYAFVPANRYDSIIAPTVLFALKELDLDIAFVLGDAAYDSKDVRKAAGQLGSYMITPINKRNGTRKDVYARVMPAFLEMALGDLLFDQRNKVERLFHLLKHKGLENPRMFGYHRYRFHVQTMLLMHNIGCLL